MRKSMYEIKFLRARSDSALVGMIERAELDGWELGQFTVAIDPTQLLIARELWVAAMRRYRDRDTSVSSVIEEATSKETNLDG
jgi:hypothetical protein